jgi:hypothetical protein
VGPLAHPMSEVARTSLRFWEQEIAVLRSVLDRAIARQNSLLPCATLPPEILGRIFELLPSLQQSPFSKENPNGMGWIAVTRVCRSWRTVALEHATLWADLELGSRQRWAVFLHRARQSPLCVHGTALSRGPQSRQLAKHFHHIRKLDLLIKDESIVSTLSSATNAPELQILKLSNSHSLSQRQATGIFRPEFFSDVAPNLHDVYLSGYSFPWTTTAPNLRSLVIWPSTDSLLSEEHHAPHNTPHVTVRQVLQCLSRMPNLTTLDIFPFDVSPTPPLTTEENPVSFPSLTTLKLSGPQRVCLDMWRTMRPHPLAATQICLESGFGYDDAPMIDEAALVLLKHLSIPGFPTFTNLSLERDDSYLQVRISLPFSSGEGQLVSTFDDAAVQVGFVAYPSHEWMTQFRALIPTTTLEQLYCLTLSNILSIPSTDCNWLLKCTKSLETIDIVDATSHCAAILLQALNTPTSSDSAQIDQPPLLVPSLRTLQFTRITFDSPSTPQQQSLYDVLRDMLYARRKVFGRSLLSVKFTECTVHNSWINELKHDIGCVVEWDGLSGEEDEWDGYGDDDGDDDGDDEDDDELFS